MIRLCYATALVKALDLSKTKRAKAALPQSKLDDIVFRSLQSQGGNLLGAQQTISPTVTEINYEDWDFLTVPIYLTSGSSTATTMAISTILDMVYVEDDSCTDCLGSLFTYGSTDEATFTKSLNYPALTLAGQNSEADMDISFDSTWSTLYVSSASVGLVDAYSGTAYIDTTWDGDAIIDGWLGLAGGSNNLLTLLQTNNMLDTRYFSLEVQLLQTSVLEIGSTSSSPQWYPSADSSLYAANIVGFMVTRSPDATVLRNSWVLDAKLAIIDTTSKVTLIPVTYFDFVMEQVMQYSRGFYYDSDLETYVLSCDQYAVLQDLYIKFDSVDGYSGNLWFSLQPIDYLSEIYTTDQCSVQLKSNPDDEWVLGLNFLNAYTLDCNMDTQEFSIVDYGGVKSFYSTTEPFQPIMDPTDTTPKTQIAIQSAMTLLFTFQVWHHFIYRPSKVQPNTAQANDYNTTSFNTTALL